MNKPQTIQIFLPDSSPKIICVIKIIEQTEGQYSDWSA